MHKNVIKRLFIYVMGKIYSVNFDNRITNISATLKDTHAQSQSERIRGPRKVGSSTVHVKTAHL